MNKWLQKLEPNARYFLWIFGMVLAVATVASIHDILSQSNPFILWVLWISLILFFFAGLIVFTYDLQRSRKQESKEILTHTERPGRNRWITIEAVVLVAIIVGLIFVARQLPATPQGYQAFFIAFAGIGAWVTGVALAVFAYQQYKLRQTEHRLLFEPQILLKPAEIQEPEKLTYNNKIYPYGIEWTVLIHNTSQQPIFIESMSLRIIQRGWGKAADKEGYLSPPSYHVLEPNGLEPPFEVTLTTPQRIRWIIEGTNAGLDLEDNFGDSNNRNFQLIFYVQAINPQDPSTSIFSRIISNSFRIPKDAKWGTSTPVTSGGPRAW